MKDLLTQFSIQEILIFLVLFAVAFKAVVTFWDWLSGWIKSKVNKDDSCEKAKQEINQRVDTIYAMTNSQEERMNKMSKALDLLVESDKDNIKSWIVEKHHHFCYEVGAIDYFSLESIERRYDHYQAENGNSYVATLIKELKELPKIENESILRTQTAYKKGMAEEKTKN